MYIYHKQCEIVPVHRDPVQIMHHPPLHQASASESLIKMIMMAVVLSLLLYLTASIVFSMIIVWHGWIFPTQIIFTFTGQCDVIFEPIATKIQFS